jgi:hypothetical protein
VRGAIYDLNLDGPGWATAEAFEDGEALFASVCDMGLEGVVANKHSERYRPGEPRWSSSSTRTTGGASRR